MKQFTQTLTTVGEACLECGSETELYVFPHRYAGIWQCLNRDCGASDSHQHEAALVHGTYDSHSPSEITSQAADYTECAVCGVQLDGEEF